MSLQQLFFCTGILHLLVQTNKLTKAYGDFLALDDCTMSVGQGEVFGLLGPNGAGKTTLLRLMMGFLRPTSGSATTSAPCGTGRWLASGPQTNAYILAKNKFGEQGEDPNRDGAPSE